MNINSNDNINMDKSDHNEQTERKTEDSSIQDFDNSPAQMKVNKRYLNLIDSDSEDENVFSSNENNSFNNITDVKNENVNKQKCVKKISSRASKENAMKEIHSESQRFLRERNVALPYHRPKQRSLQEFFNRKKVLLSLPQAPTMAAKIKMSTLIVSKITKEKEKEAELFYKSSDSEEEIPPSQSPLKEISTSTNEKQNLSIENINVKDTHNKTENSQDVYVTQGIIQPKLNFNEKAMCNEHFRNVKEKVTESSTLMANTTDDRDQDKEHKYDSDTSEKLINTMNSKKREKPENHDNTARLKNNLSDDGIEISNVLVKQHTDEILDTKYDDKETASLRKDINNPDISMSEADKRINLDNIENISSTGSNNDRNIVKNQFNELEIEDIFNTPSSQNNAELQQKNKINMKENLIPIDCTRQDTYINKGNEDDNLQKSPCTFTLKINNDYAKIVKQSLGISEADGEEYNEYGLPPPRFDDEESSHIKEKQKFNVLDFHPKLKGIPGTTIDLPYDIKPKEGRVNGLINRFLHNRHSKLNKSLDDAPNGTAIHIKQTENGASVIKETLPYNICTTVNNDLKVSKPGAKLLRLKEELKHIIDLKRCTEWRKKEQKIEMQKDEENELQAQKDCLSDAESSEEECSEEGESDEEEDYVYVNKKTQRSKCPFADDEADVSQDGSDENSEISSENNDNEYGEYSSDNEKDEDNSVNNDNGDRSNTDDSKKSKKYRRIINLSDDDSNIISAKDLGDEVNDIDKNSLLNNKTDVHTFQADNGDDVWLSDNENQLHMSQRCIENDIVHQTCHTPQSKTNILDFISPITQLTALNTRSDFEKQESNQSEQFSFINELGTVSVENTPTEKLSQQTGATQKTFRLQKQFFDDSEHVITGEDLLQLCSGNFPSTGKNDLNLSRESNLSESQLLDLGCGALNTQVDNEDDLKSNDSSERKLLLNESLMSNTESTTNIKEQLQRNQDSSCIGLHVFSSDEEDRVDMIENIKKRVKRKVKKLNLSDEDDEEEGIEENDTSTSDNKEQEYSNHEEDYIDYDSEENDFTISKKQYATGFFEEEAELSESDWDGSEDEDEKDLDKLELEEGDREELDENQVKDQLGKIHMRQMLDDDQRNIRMLKELLFEDGDLHADGSGRERKFKWKNIDKMGNDNDHYRVENEDGFEDLLEGEDENEVKWRKMRYEREKFLEEKMKNLDSEIEDDLNSSKMFQIGMKVFKRNQDILANEIETIDATTFRHTICEILDGSNMEGRSHVIHKVLQKRSFLARGDAELARIRPILEKQKDLPVRPINKRNFVFPVIDSATEKKCEMPEETKTPEKINLNRKNRKRKSFGDATPRSVKRVKTAEQSTKEKAL